MSLLTNLVNGLTGNGNHVTRNGHERNRIERLCQELGWGVDERDNKTIKLHFKDALAGIRKLYVHGGDNPLVLMTVFSFVMIPADNVPDEVLGYLLRQNNEISVGAWTASLTDEGEAMFSLKYYALDAGLNAGTFKYICHELIPEAAAFDQKMRQAGLLS